MQAKAKQKQSETKEKKSKDERQENRPIQEVKPEDYTLRSKTLVCPPLRRCKRWAFDGRDVFQHSKHTLNPEKQVHRLVAVAEPPF